MDNLQFKVSSAVKDLVGKDLIRNENIAIFELVKNSYDAFAAKVEITFKTDRIIIADNGKGMTLNDLKNKWLFLAYSAKKDGMRQRQPQTKSKNPPRKQSSGLRRWSKLSGRRRRTKSARSRIHSSGLSARNERQKRSRSSRAAAPAARSRKVSSAEMIQQPLKMQVRQKPRKRNAQNSGIIPRREAFSPMPQIFWQDFCFFPPSSLRLSRSCLARRLG